MANKTAKFLSLAGLLAATSTAAPAFADDQSQSANCIVSYVQYTADQLIVRCTTNVDHFVYGPTHTGCAYRQSAETLKIWTSMAEGAFLSGKPMTINYYAAGLGGCQPGNAAVLMALGLF